MTNTTNTAADSVTAILFEHEDGRYAINPNTTGDPAWHRLGPVDVSAIAAAPAQQVAPDGGSIVRLVEEKIAAMSPSEVAAFMTARAALAAPKAEPAAPDITDAYAGAQEDIAIWKKRALEAEALNHRFIADINGPTFLGEPTTSDDAFIAREFYESQDDSLLLCASDLQHSAIYDNHIEMQSCIRAVADRITALASVIEGVERAALAAPAQPVAWQVNHIADHVADNWPMRKYDLAEIEQRLRGIPAAPQPAAQAAPVDAATWQPIASAPKDGKAILLRSKNGRIADGLWSAANSHAGFWAWAYVHQEPVEWMPKPGSPAARAQEQQP